MPKGKKSTNYDAVGSIFDFIFSEADKPVDKRRPIKPSGFSAEGALVDGIAVALESPGAFVSNQIIDEFNDALDLTLTQADFNEYGKIKITTQNLARFIKDPAGVVDNAIKRAKGLRKASRVRMLGEVMDDFLTTAWAHKFGDLEAQHIALASASANEKAESYKVAKAVGQSTRPTERVVGMGGITTPVKGVDVPKDFTVDRTLELIGRKTFGGNWDTLSESDKTKFTKFLLYEPGRVRKVSTREVQSFLSLNFSPSVAANFDTVLTSFGRDEKVDITSPEVYRALEEDNITERINALSAGAPGSSEEAQRKIYEKTKVLVSLRTEKQIQELSDRLARASTTPTDPSYLTSEERVRITQAINDGRTARRLLGGKQNLFSSIGKWEGYINSINNVWGGVMGAQKLIPSMIDGSFFDENKNTFSPVAKKEKKVAGIEILEARIAKGPGSTIKNAYNVMGESLYYMTPKSIFRTLFINGEGFARLLNQNNKMLSHLSNTFGGLGVAGLTAEDIISSIDSKYGRDLKTYLEGIITQIEGGTLGINDQKAIIKLLGRSKSYRNFTQRHSYFTRIKEVYQKRIGDRIAARTLLLRQKIADFFRSKPQIAGWFARHGGNELLETFIAKGGLKNLVQPVVTAVLGIMGVTLSPIINIAVSAVSGAIIMLALKGLKVLLQIGQIVIIAFVAVVVLGLGGARKVWRDFNKRSYSYNYVVPNTVNFCEEYSELYPEPIMPNPNVPILSGQCILGEEQKHCTQGWDINASFSNGLCFSHNYPGMHVDLTGVNYIIAPEFCDDPGSECRVISSRSWYCGFDGKYAGDEVVFSLKTGEYTFTFNFLHVKLLPGFSSGSNLSSGAFAYVQDGTEISVGKCWSGKHLHLEYAKVNGTAVDPFQVLLAFDCNVPASVHECTNCNGGGGEVDMPVIELPGTGQNPYAGSITQSASQIVGFLGKGYWNYYNRPQPNMPATLSYDGGNLIWSQQKYDMWLSVWQYENDDGLSRLNNDIYSLYWCTWLTYKSYILAGVPNANSVLRYFGVSSLKSSFSSAGNGYSFISNGSNVVKSISPGDVIFYSRNSRDAHVGIVKSVSSNTITTLESNAGYTQSTLTVNDDGSISGVGTLSVSGFGVYRK